MPIKRKRTTIEKIAIFKDLFCRGRMDIYGSYDPKTGRSFQVKNPVNDQIILTHLKGQHPFGSYMLEEDKTSLVVADFDSHDRNPVVAFVNSAHNYSLNVAVEKSKSKGFHCFLFFVGSVSAIKARIVFNRILEDIDCTDTEIFPKQNVLVEGQSGNFINAPLFGLLVPEGKTVFVDPVSFKPFSDQWDYLSKIERVTEENLDELIELNDWSLIGNHQEKINKSCKPKVGNKFQTLLPCALHMLRGVSQLQKVRCFRLAIHLCSAGFDQIMSQEILKIWATRNTPINGKTIIKDSEIIAQCNDGFKENHTSYGCGTPETRPYCSKTCKLFNVNIKI
jgi:hypothetical protein